MDAEPSLLACPVVPTDPDRDVTLTHLSGAQHPLDDWLTTFHLAVVVLDPYTYESAWVLETAGKILEHFRGASVRNAFVLTCDEADAKRFLGPWADRILTFVDPDRKFVEVCGLESLPALVHLRQDLVIEAAAQGWDPMEWRAIGHEVARERNWTRPTIPAPRDPDPFPGSPAMGRTAQEA